MSVTKRSNIAGLVPVILLAAVVAGCTAPHAAVRRATVTRYVERQAGFTPQELTWIGDLCPFGLPAKQSPFGKTVVVVRGDADGRAEYVLEHSAGDKIALWVCEKVTKDGVDGPFKRDQLSPREPFRADDGKLDAGERAELTDYEAVTAEYARGHMAPVADFKDSLARMKDTFFLSNMVPQERKQNQFWASVENRARAWARDGDVFAITGGMFYDPKEDDPATADGLIPYFLAGDNAVAIPTHVYKVALRQTAGGAWEGIAIVMENVDPGELHIADLVAPEYIKSIDWLEARTGLNFFPDMPTAEQAAVESATHSAIWPTGN